MWNLLEEKDGASEHRRSDHCPEAKLRPYIEEMELNMAQVLGIQKDRINVKATTEEGLGFTGTGEGMAAQAVCCLEEA